MRKTMPGLTQLLNAFGIHQHLQLAGYLLQTISGNEHTISRYHEYSYPIQLTFVPQNNQSNPQNLVNLLSQLTSGNRVVNSQYGNPYNCNLQLTNYQQIGNNIVVSLLGHSQRI